MGRHQLVQCQLYTIVRSKVTARITTDPLISVQHFWSLIFLIFKLSESFWNHFKTTFLTQEMNFKKNLVEKIYFFVIEKYFWFFLIKSKFRKKKSKKFSTHFWFFDFGKNFKNISGFFSKYFFDHKKIKIFDEIFF